MLLSYDNCILHIVLFWEVYLLFIQLSYQPKMYFYYTVQYFYFLKLVETDFVYCIKWVNSSMVVIVIFCFKKFITDVILHTLNN